ncbi:MAG: ABC transporter permease [Aigarchaeota archaeon]|nr:ABC transporter permease [Aigarchaeota archaeon]MDW7985960.1 ABC transporter permease [Nitrososphaerota archaeon]
MNLRESLKEFWRLNVSKVGLIFLSMLILASIYVVASYPLDFGVRYWNNPSYWADYPKSAPPAWVNLISSEKAPEHYVLTYTKPSNITLTGTERKLSYIFEIDFQADRPPSFISFTILDITYHERPSTVKLSVLRPDMKNIEVYSFIVSGPYLGEEPPYRRYYDQPKRISITGDMLTATALSRFLYREYNVTLRPSEVNSIGQHKILFSIPVRDREFKVLKGQYIFTIDVYTYNPNDEVGEVTLVIGGEVYGVMGTDSLGRDLFIGLLFGFPVALFIGIVTSTITTLLGAGLGIVGGYLGGRVDEVIQRIADFINNIPLLPFLIFLAFILGQNIWILVFLLVVFGWPTLTIIVRSMVLQLKSGQFIEAAISIGAPRWWIMFKHIFPQVAPFIFAQLIFFTPTFILLEAALSFLGLGDPTLPTWGQILEYGFRSGGIYVGLWWWIIPPGILIIWTAITFVLIALGMEPVVNPRLRKIK